MATILLDSTPVGAGQRPYVIAEMSGNHNGDIERAFEIIDAAADNGADAVKFQTYSPETMTIRSPRSDFQIEGGLWDGYSLWDLYDWAHTPFDWHPELFEHARSRGISCFSTPFDETAVDLLEGLDCAFYKIASFELTDLPLVKRVASTGKPIIMSTGMATLDEIAESLDTARSAGCKDIVVLHCVSGYPTPVEEANLACIPELANRFGTIVGLSDHTIGNAASIAAVSLGAAVIEKHFTLDRAAGGPDAEFSMEPAELRALRDGVSDAWKAIGQPDFSQKSSERSNVKFRRSVYAVRDIAKGEKFTTMNVRRIRPGFGVPPKYYESIVGNEALSDIEAGTAIKLEHFQNE